MAKFSNLSLRDIEFENCKLAGIKFYECQTELLEIKFNKCLIMYCNFLNLDLRNTLFVECEIKGTDFIDNNLTKADFSKSIFDKSIFHNANLTHANFTGAINYCINPKDNILKKTKFSKPEVISLLQTLDIIIEE